MFKHLLVPTDGSPLSQATVARAASYAKEAGARITLFYAKPPLPAAYDGVGGLSSAHLTQDMQARLDSAAQDTLTAAETLASEAGVSVEKMILVGFHPYELIIQAADTQGCDLIFMASHGRRGVSALLLGSETNKVLTHSKIPVLVYR
jgi:nucleotide-binding universal stress UspA family protein